jgi:hypothetical protein
MVWPPYSVAQIFDLRLNHTVRFAPNSGALALDLLGGLFAPKPPSPCLQSPILTGLKKLVAAEVANAASYISDLDGLVCNGLVGYQSDLVNLVWVRRRGGQSGRGPRSEMVTMVTICSLPKYVPRYQTPDCHSKAVIVRLTSKVLTTIPFRHISI